VVENEELNRSLSTALPLGLQVIGITKNSYFKNKIKASKQINYQSFSIPWGGDIVIAINNIRVTSIKDVKQLIWQFRNQKILKISLQRFNGGIYEIDWENS